MKDNNQENINFLEKIANGIMSWIGSIPSLIAHTLAFLISFLLPVFDIVSFDKMLLVLTTILSLEAIYLSIFIQMSVNKSQEHIEEIQEDIEDIQEDIEDISDEIDEISDDIEVIQEDLEDISDEIDEISEDIEDIQEDIEEISEEEGDEEDHNERAKNVMLKSNVSISKSEIKMLKEKIALLTIELEKLKKEEHNADEEENLGEF